EASALKAMRRLKTLVLFWQIAILVFVIGMWELSSNMQWIYPFFYSSPSVVVQRLYEWATEGTTEGSLCYNLWVTMEEALIGFFACSITGVFVG
ncbi:ABC transporter permease, partial [Rhizobium ruizarguesonis]